MNILAIIVAFVAGGTCGCIGMCMLHANRDNKLERYQAELDSYRRELEHEKYQLDHDWECPPAPTCEKGKENASYQRIIINK